MPDQAQTSSNKGKVQTKAAIDNKKKLDLPLDFSFKDLGDVSGKCTNLANRRLQIAYSNGKNVDA